MWENVWEESQTRNPYGGTHGWKSVMIVTNPSILNGGWGNIRVFIYYKGRCAGFSQVMKSVPLRRLDASSSMNMNLPMLLRGWDEWRTQEWNWW